MHDLEYLLPSAERPQLLVASVELLVEGVEQVSENAWSHWERAQKF